MDYLGEVDLSKISSAIGGFAKSGVSFYSTYRQLEAMRRNATSQDELNEIDKQIADLRLAEAQKEFAQLQQAKSNTEKITKYTAIGGGLLLAGIALFG